jgi:sarcosine oxidase
MIRGDGIVVGLGAMGGATAYHLGSTEKIRYRFSMIRLKDGWVGLFEPGAGAVFPERCIQAFLSGLNRLGADIRFDERVLSERAAA